jgi:hypothetical protein
VQCIGVKVVAYKDASGTPTLSQAGAEQAIQNINQIWKSCNVAFQIETYQAIDPTTVGLSFGEASQRETTQIRQKFSDNKTFLYVITGHWTTSTIAWTEMPGGAPYGTIVESAYGAHTVAVAHEFGHYMGLDHINTNGNLMYPVVYPSDTSISASQCGTARSTNAGFWAAMLR